MKKIEFLAVLMAMALFGACTKEAGFGGKASIQGSVKLNTYNSIGQVIHSEQNKDQRIYIIYGEQDNVVDDDTRSSYDGSFAFRNLNPGKYKVFMYSEYLGQTNNVNDSTVLFDVHVTQKNEQIDLGEIIIAKNG